MQYENPPCATLELPHLRFYCHDQKEDVVAVAGGHDGAVGRHQSPHQLRHTAQAQLVWQRKGGKHQAHGTASAIARPNVSGLGLFASPKSIVYKGGYGFVDEIVAGVPAMFAEYDSEAPERY